MSSFSSMSLRDTYTKRKDQLSQSLSNFANRPDVQNFSQQAASQASQLKSSITTGIQNMDLPSKAADFQKKHLIMKRQPTTRQVSQEQAPAPPQRQESASHLQTAELEWNRDVVSGKSNAVTAAAPSDAPLEGPFAGGLRFGTTTTQLQKGVGTSASQLQKGVATGATQLQRGVATGATHLQKAVVTGAAQLSSGIQTIGHNLQQLDLKTSLAATLQSKQRQEEMEEARRRKQQELEEEEERQRVIRESEEACLAQIQIHLVDFLERNPKATYEDWIEELHPENAHEGKLLVGLDKSIDFRFYVEESDHRRLWNQNLNDERLGVPPRTRMFREDEPQIPPDLLMMDEADRAVNGITEEGGELFTMGYVPKPGETTESGDNGGDLIVFD